MIAIIDYGAGNLTSVVKAVRHVGGECIVTSDAAQLAIADKVIVPGVGNFRATRPLSDGALADALRAAIVAQTPTLGICLGLQWMFEGSEEAAGLRGLGAFSGACTRFSTALKVPHVGWNQITIAASSRLLHGLPPGPYVYFTHSYRAPLCADTTAQCIYDAPFTAAVERDNLFGLQFHPEKSGDVGLRLLENFCAL
jgi:imidazole glycerol-phosphate synthase subunit HisH